MRRVSVGSFTRSEKLFGAVPEGKVHDRIVLTLTNKGAEQVKVRVRVKRGSDFYEVAETVPLPSRMATVVRMDHPMVDGDRLSLMQFGGGDDAPFEIDYVLSYDRRDEDDPDAGAGTAALQSIATALDGLDTNADLVAGVVALGNRVVEVKDELESAKTSSQTALGALGTQVSEGVTSLATAAGAQALAVTEGAGVVVAAVEALSSRLASELSKVQSKIGDLGDLPTKVDGIGSKVEQLGTTLSTTVASIGSKLGEAVNVAAARLSSAVSLTSADQDVLSVSITPSSDQAQVRIWLTLFWQGDVTYRIYQGTTAVIPEQLTSSSESGSAEEPIVFPVSHSPASAEAVTYTLKAKTSADAGTNQVSEGTTLHVEEIPG